MKCIPATIIVCSVALFFWAAELKAESNGKLGSKSVGSASISLTIPARMELQKRTVSTNNKSQAFCVKGTGVQGYYVDLFTASGNKASLSHVSRSNRRHLNGASRQLVNLSSKSRIDCERNSSNEFLEVKLSSLSYTKDTVLMAEPL